MYPNDSAKSPDTRKTVLGRGSQGSTIKTGHERLKNNRQESKENEDLINCMDSNIVQGSGVVSIASGRRVLAEEPTYIDKRQNKDGNKATIRSTMSGSMEDTHNSLRSGQPRERNEENDTVSRYFNPS